MDLSGHGECAFNAGHLTEHPVRHPIECVKAPCNQPIEAYAVQGDEVADSFRPRLREVERESDRLLGEMRTLSRRLVASEGSERRLRQVRVGQRVDEGALEVLAGLSAGERVALDARAVARPARATETICGRPPGNGRPFRILCPAVRARGTR